MSRWGLRTSPQFDQEARRLDPAVLRRVKVYLDSACDLEDPRQRGRGLTGDFAGYWRYRIGGWRVIVEIRDEELVVIAIGQPRAPLHDLPTAVERRRHAASVP